MLDLVGSPEYCRQMTAECRHVGAVPPCLSAVVHVSEDERDFEADLAGLELLALAESRVQQCFDLEVAG